MGIYDRDYMREEDPADWWKPGYSTKRWLIIGILAVSLLTSVLYFARTARIGPMKQSAARAENLSLKVNINTATEEELDTLPNHRSRTRKADHRGKAVQVRRRAQEGQRHPRQATRG